MEHDADVVVRPMVISEVKTRLQIRHQVNLPAGTGSINFTGDHTSVSEPTNLPYSPADLMWKGGVHLSCSAKAAFALCTSARFVFRSSSSAIGWAQNNKYFHILSRGVERDGWKFVLLARFSPIPSYVINYALAATKVRFFLDFLLPTAIGCLPMILQNTSIGSLAGAAVSSGSGSKTFNLRSYIFPLLGILASILISLRVKKYSKDISVAETVPTEDNDNNRLSERKKGKVSKKR
ncbi:PREDICTED: uncharacterized protein LOC109215850 [Nicotiana attenuata]|uniref:uncharacterized protein LOC109215850 n=1 Tax=Nicotiana attenuata TaxID=49451 RepID=UPI0009046203|nr:PREDICTED: uncharacterized protein LOC109215850 [Nicotiana attenuata]